MKKKSNRGGARQGAGRPPEGESAKILMTAKIDPQSHQIMDEQCESMGISRGKFIDWLIKIAKEAKKF